VDILADAFRGVNGFQVDYMPDWETRGRSYFTPVGQVNHHTGKGSYSALLNYMTYGSSIAPLCNIATSRPSNGIVRLTVVSSGRANHAGKGYLPWTGKNNGNRMSIGWEHQNNGGQDWPDQQNEAIARGNIAVMDYLKHPIDRIVDHRTYAPTRKVDRYNWTATKWQQYLKDFNNKEVYTMLLYGKRGTPDYAAACAALDLSKQPGVCTSNLDEAKAAVSRGEKVLAIGGQAARDLDFEYVPGSVRVRGNKVAVVGSDGLNTLLLLEQALR
jgi:hypothetical protein